MGRPKIIEDTELLAIAREVFRRHGHTASTRQVQKTLLREQWTKS